MRRSGGIGQQEDEGEINITPMLDVVFIMLIFFIVTATFVKEPGIDINKPKASTAMSQPQANILIAISPTNDIHINRKKVAPEQVRTTIERLRAENPQGTAVIQADQDSSYKVTKVVMEAAKQAGVTTIALSAEK